MSRRDEPGTVYLLHFDQAVADHARHYIGWASDLEARLADHRQGRGARLMEVLRERGIGWHLARTWEGTRTRGAGDQGPGRGAAAVPGLHSAPQAGGAGPLGVSGTGRQDRTGTGP